nr:hypothetical protein [Halarsenatibacter silvermanii]
MFEFILIQKFSVIKFFDVFNDRYRINLHLPVLFADGFIRLREDIPAGEQHKEDNNNILLNFDVG